MCGIIQKKEQNLFSNSSKQSLIFRKRKLNTCQLIFYKSQEGSFILGRSLFILFYIFSLEITWHYSFTLTILNNQMNPLQIQINILKQSSLLQRLQINVYSRKGLKTSIVLLFDTSTCLSQVRKKERRGGITWRDSRIFQKKNVGSQQFLTTKSDREKYRLI